jgi:porphobilinogen deaminase
MPAPGWLTYLGAVTGVIGTFTGIAGAVMGYISYRRSSQLKALDLRLELRKQQGDVEEALRDLPALLESDHQSRIAVASATGLLRTGATEAWKQQLETDRSAIAALTTQPKSPNNEYASLTHSMLEDRLVELHRLRSTVNQYVDKYRAAIAADDRVREHIRADMRARHQGQL